MSREAEMYIEDIGGKNIENNEDNSFDSTSKSDTENDDFLENLGEKAKPKTILSDEKVEWDYRSKKSILADLGDDDMRDEIGEFDVGDSGNFKYGEAESYMFWIYK